MGTGQSRCPNCGGELATYRTIRQTAGRREATLYWSICLECRHVALQKWELVDKIEPPVEQVRT
jgi:hypothetical protein